MNFITNFVAGNPTDIDVMGDLVFVTDSSKLHVFSLMGVFLASKDVDGFGESKKITVLEPYIYVNDVLDWEPLTYRMKF